MAESIALSATSDKAARYRELLPQLASLVDGEPDLIANLANITAGLKECLPIASWIGFYITRSPNELVLGPFQQRLVRVGGRREQPVRRAEQVAQILPHVVVRQAQYADAIGLGELHFAFFNGP